MRNVLNEIVETAMNMLEYDDMNPNVDMGMNYRTAVADSVTLLKRESEKYGLTLEVSASTIDSAVNEVLTKRVARRY